MSLSFMWWGSLLQSLAPDSFLKLRHLPSFGSTRFSKRLDPSESSTGSNASFADTWLRSEFDDLDALLAWSEKQQGQGVIVLDLWRWSLEGRLLSEHSKLLESIIDQSKLVVFLMPRVLYGGWKDNAQRLVGEAHPVGLIEERMEALRASYEFLINWPKPFAIFESSFTERDFVDLLELDFTRTRKVAGLIHLVPRDVASSSFGLHSNEPLVGALVGLLTRAVARPSANLLVSLPPGSLHSFRCQGSNSVQAAKMARPFPVIRRADGVLALPTSWTLYKRALVPEPGVRLGRDAPGQLSFAERQWLLFLTRYEAFLAEVQERQTRTRASDAAMEGALSRASM